MDSLTNVPRRTETTERLRRGRSTPGTQFTPNLVADQNPNPRPHILVLGFKASLSYEARMLWPELLIKRRRNESLS